MNDRVHLFGIRHHGPGSARSVEHALEALSPDCVLVEGPPDANDLLPLAAHAELEPPIALLVYLPESPRSAVFYPFATFSPEWRAIRYALARSVPVRFIDLPQSARLQVAVDDSALGPVAEHENAPATSPEADADEAIGSNAEDRSLRTDPLAPVARVAGYDDPERWWDHLVESRGGDDVQVFAALHEMMVAVRAELPEPEPEEQRREAHMRRAIRAALGEGFQRVAVICGAFHTPALATMPSARDDDALLKGLPRAKTAAAWVPWTYERLSYHSGYGAGVESPAWYELLWTKRAALGAHWLGRAARLLRDEDVPISSAHVIEACRLAEALAAVRDRPVATLAEYNDAAAAVLGGGDDLVMRLIGRKWHFGSRLGRVPDDFPAAPLARDLAAEQKRLRLPPKADEKTHDLDLREVLDRDRSALLRRLRILGVEWGIPAGGGPRSRGTFRELWTLRWQPEFAVTLIEASRHGHTLQQAASARVLEAASSAATLPELVEKLQDVLHADLPDALGPLVAAIENRTAASSDVAQLLGALPPLVDVVRYGDVRGTDAGLVNEILAGLVPRLFVGLLPATAGIDDDAARALWGKLRAAAQSFVALGNDDFHSGWLDALAKVSGSSAAHELLRGYACRILYDARRLDAPALEAALAFALSSGAEPAKAAGWIEGLLSGSAALIVHDDALRGAVDRWLRALSAEHFVQVLPLLRRTFAEFPAPERRLIGARLKSGGSVAPVASRLDFDEDAALATAAVLQAIWGGGGSQ